MVALNEERIVAIVGPTGSGKSALAMAAARRFGGEIVSCDSVQVYRGLDIGSGKASLAERALTPHHLVDILGLDEEMNAAVFAERAAAAIQDILDRGRLPIVTGGTGLYLTALLKGLFEQEPVSPDLRLRLVRLAERYGVARLHRLLSSKDPRYAARTKPGDRVRVVRALEVCFSTGRPFSDNQQERRPTFSGVALIVGLDVARSVLRDRVSRRVRGMLENGLIDETRRALGGTVGTLPLPRPLGAIGYRQVVERMQRGALDPRGDDELQRAIVTSTMQYAKRQMTYFRRQFEVEWFADPQAAQDRMEAWLDEPGSAGNPAQKGSN